MSGVGGFFQPGSTWPSIPGVRKWRDICILGDIRGGNINPLQLPSPPLHHHPQQLSFTISLLLQLLLSLSVLFRPTRKTKMQLPTTLLIVATSLISGVLSLPADTSGSADAAAPNTTDTGDASGSADVASAGTTSSSGPGLILPSCPVAQCNPSPPQNRCDITTSCIQTQPNRQFHCACR